VDNGFYFERGGQLGVETKRGCPGRCIYCADPVIKGRKSRLRPPGDVAAEFQSLLEQGADHFHLCDSEFNVPPGHAEAVCEALTAAGLAGKIRWYAYASAVPFTEELATLMMRAGCAGVNFGVDHGSDGQLRALGRDYGTREIVETARICRKLGLVFMYDLLLGAPGETRQSVRETIELMKTVAPDRVGVSLGVRIYPGTPLHARLRGEAETAEGVKGSLEGLAPVFYMSPALGPRPFDWVRELVGGDDRFLVPTGGDQQNYNYNDNSVLQRAIDAGYRGAYWDVLRRLPEDP
jgi:radical SAM superfamily enzyme YgiQ (UPF0313 family)